MTDSASAIEQAEGKPVESKTNTEAVHRALGMLEPELRNVLRLWYSDSFSLKEIAELLELPTGTIKSRLYCARKRLEQTMEKKNDD